MDGDEEIARVAAILGTNGNVVSDLAKQYCPTDGGDAVSVPLATSRRCYNPDFQSARAQRPERSISKKSIITNVAAKASPRIKRQPDK